MDLRRAHSLPESSQYFKDNILASPVDQAESNMCATPSIPLRMPASLFTKDRTAFVGLGWSKIATALPPMTSLEEKAFLSTLLQELNLEFALQLDISPKVDRLPHTPEVSGSRTLIFGAGAMQGGSPQRWGPSTQRWWTSPSAAGNCWKRRPKIWPKTLRT